ncbi:MAG: hydrogen gas-evolving membrane-bound hydrogenase subunit E [Pseudonocardia sediminis]
MFLHPALLALVIMAALVVAVPLLVRALGRNAGYPLAAGFLAVGLLLAYGALGPISNGYLRWEWLPSLGVGFALRLDGLGALFCLLVLGVGALVMAYCPRYLGPDGRHTPVYALLTLFATAMLGLVLAADVLLLYVFWELTTVCSFFLIKTAGTKAGPAAGRALLVTGAGGLSLLTGLVLLTVAAGTSDLTAILSRPEVVLSSPLAVPIALLIVFAAFTKSAQMPFHFWLPGAMVAMTPISAYLHAATMVKAGIYVLMRFTPLFGGQPYWAIPLIAFGLVTAVGGAVMALREFDLKAILAHSTVSQLGLLVGVIGVGTSTAIAAALLHTFAHALFKATLFMLVGIIDKEAGSRDIRRLTGLRRVMPVTATFTALAAMSMAGIPPMLGFVSKEYLFQGFVDLGGWAGVVAGGLAVLASALTFAYGARIVFGAFGGGSCPQTNLYEPAPAFLAPAVVPALAGLALGPAVSLLSPVIAAAGVTLVAGAGDTELEFWHGLSPELGMSVLTIALGATLFWQRDRVERAVLRLRPPDGAALFDRGQDAVIRFGGLVGRPDRDASSAQLLARPLLVLAVPGLVALIAAGAPSTAPPGVDPLDWPLLVLLAAAVAGTALARSRLAAIGLLGIVGLVLVLWFLVTGATDVALTLLLVEVLTAVVAVLVLRGLPARTPRPSRRRSVTALAVAVPSALAAAAGTFVLTGGRGLSGLGEYFLANAEPETGGRNVVNTILVDFRGVDTLGEAAVVGAAALALLVLLPRRGRDDGEPVAEPPGYPGADAVVLQVASVVLVPGAFLLSAFLFLRGHDEPGGGFISALVAGTAVGFSHYAHGGRSTLVAALRPERLVGAGLLVGVATGLAPMLAGMPFLTPVSAPFSVPLIGVTPSSVLAFEVCVFLLVLAMFVAAVDRFAAPGRAGEPVPEAAGDAARETAGSLR